MSDEAAFLRAIQANPADTTAKLVYADWLDEHGEAEKAEYLRLSARLQLAKKPSDPGYHRLYELECRHRVWAELVRSQRPMWDEVTMFAFGQLCGLFTGYAGLSAHASDISYYFDAHLAPHTGTLAEVVNRGSGDSAVTFDLEHLADWESSLRNVLRDWLFRELRQLTNSRHTRLAFLTEDGREGLIADAMAHIRAVINPTTGWRLVLTGDGRHGIDWSDLALEAQDRVLILHFSFDD
jgi:uncharacterized protein (TIGR02996 family)